MNNKRRERIKICMAGLENIKNTLENILNEEQDSYDNIPENLLDSERALISEESIDILNEVINQLEEIL